MYLWSYPTTDNGAVAYPDFFIHKYAVVYHSLGVFFFFVALMFSTVLIKIMESDLLLLLGKYSVAMYFIHVPVIISFSSYIFIMLPAEWEYHNKILMVFISTFMMLPIVTVVFDYIISQAIKTVTLLYRIQAA